MANEATLVQRLEDRLFTVKVADGTALTKGTILAFSTDANTAVASSADGDLFAGILAEDKVANDGQTQVSVWRKGVFAVKVGGTQTATMGNKLKIVGANLVGDGDATTLADMSEHFAIALEAGASNETIQVLLTG